MTTCPSCAAENPDSSQYCSACGSALDPSLAKTVQQTPGAQPFSSSTASDSDSSVHGRFLPGTKIADRYRIVSLAGRGGMGEVYRADDLKLHHPVALKFLPGDVSEGSRRFQYFLAEVRLSRQIAHPNVCRVYDIDEVDGQQFLSMEYIDGEDLKGLLRRIGRLPKDKGIQIAQQLCAGLAAAHEKGVLHRDLKPANIMIDSRGQARITDFGLARLADGAAGAGEISGTPGYMAPEQLARGEATIQSDLYSLALILYEIFTGQSAHKGGSPQELVRSHEETSLTQPSALVDDIDPAVERVILRCLEKEPSHRPKSARAVAAALPGGDPLAAALAAGETPSPEMVAAAGEEGAIEKRWGLTCLAGVVIGLVLVCWLAQRTYLVNQVGLDRHPASLADDARRMIESFGYTNSRAREAFGFRDAGNDSVRFWYRQHPTGFLAQSFYNGWGEMSLARINYNNPPLEVPGEVRVELDPGGKLASFRAIPPAEPTHANAQAGPAWQEWLPEEITGIDLDGLELIEDQSLPPPDAYDQIQVWKGESTTGEPFYFEAAAYAGRPVYFNALNPDAFEEIEVDASRSRQFGEMLFFRVIFLVWCGSAILAWRNFRHGRIDRKGSFRVAFILFVAGMISWLFLASHIPGGYEIPVIEIGFAQALSAAAFFWLFYTALEPHTRRLWPQFLISWTRLVNGRWRDPLVGQNLLLGVLAGIASAALTQIGVLAPDWLGLASQPFRPSHPLTLDGPMALAGFVLVFMVKGVCTPLFYLIFLLFLRAALRKTWLVSAAYIALTTVIFTLFWGAHPVLGWFVIGATVSLGLWVYLRLGFLAGIVMLATNVILGQVPLTTDVSAWYFGNGFAAALFFLALAGFGFYTSQGGRPIFQEDLTERAGR